MKLIDIVDKWISGDWGEEHSTDNAQIPVHCIRSADIVSVYQFSFDKAVTRYISEHSLSRCKLSEGDIIVEKSGGTNTCSTGRVIYVDSAMLERNNPLVCSNFCTAFRVKEGWDAKYVYYYIRMIHKSGVFLNYEGKTSGIHNLLITQAYSSIDIPDISKEEQIRISTVLSAIDEKIYLNKAINHNLEALAKQLYDYWFVQFDFPDENGKPYKSSGGKMVWNEKLKREIPEGWEVKKLKQCVTSINTGLNPRDNFQLGHGNIKYITVKNLTTEGTITYNGCDTIDEEAKKLVHQRSNIAVGDILFASIAPLGRCYLIQKTPLDWDINESVFSIRVNYDNMIPEYLYQFLRSDYFIIKATNNSTGSIFLGIRINVLNETEIIVPKLTVLQKYSKYIKTIYAQKDVNQSEIEHLTKQRDELLPLLMNGQATIKQR